MRAVVAAGLCTLLGGCAPHPFDRNDVARYTGLTLCPSTHVDDLTTQEEYDTVPGYSYHLRLVLEPRCRADLEAQLARLGCPAERLRSFGCGIKDVSRFGRISKHSELGIHPIGNGYDLRIWE